MQTSSIIPTCVSYGHTKFSDNLSDLPMEDVGGIGQSTLKGDFWIKKYPFFKTNLAFVDQINDKK